MKTPLEPTPRRWRLPVLVLLGTALLSGSFAIATLALPSRADDGAPKPAPKTEPLPEITGRRTVSQGLVDVRDGVTAVLPLQPGRVAKVLAKENQEFDEGAPLYLMDDRHARFSRDQAEAALRAAEIQLDEAKKKLPEQHRLSVAGQQDIIQAKQNKRDAGQKDADDAKRLADKNLASADRAAAAQKLVDAADAEIEAEKKKLRGLELLDPDFTIRKAEQEVAAKKVQLDEAKWAVDECTVKAPYKGKVLRMQVSVGDGLPNPRQAPILFCSTAPRIVRAEIEQEFAPKVYVGQSARIKDFVSEDLGVWTGKVESISDWYTHRRSMLLEPLQFNDVRTREAIIELDPGQKPLQIGQRVRVTLPVAPPQ